MHAAARADWRRRPARLPPTRPVILTGLLTLATASTASADVGVPMIFVSWPAMLLGLLPVVFIETFLVARDLVLRPSDVVAPVLKANLLSTVVGIPLTWAVLFALELVATGGGTAAGLDTPLHAFLAVTLQAPWLVPYEPQIRWMVPSAAVFLLIPFWAASCVIENMYLQGQFDGSRSTIGRSDTDVRRAVVRANVASYVFLALVGLVWLASVLLTPNPRLREGQSAPGLDPQSGTTQPGLWRGVTMKFVNGTSTEREIETRAGWRGQRCEERINGNFFRVVDAGKTWTVDFSLAVSDSICVRSRVSTEQEWSAWEEPKYEWSADERSKSFLVSVLPGGYQVTEERR